MSLILSLCFRLTHLVSLYMFILSLFIIGPTSDPKPGNYSFSVKPTSHIDSLFEGVATPSTVVFAIEVTRDLTRIPQEMSREISQEHSQEIAPENSLRGFANYFAKYST